MGINQQKSRSGTAARDRLLEDQAWRPVAEKRAALAILSRRLEQASRTTLTQLLAARVKSDPRYMPVLQKLLRARTPD